MSYRPMSRDRYLSDDELAAFMEAVRSRRHVNQPRDRALFAILANTGVRPSEALELKRGDVRLGPEPCLLLKRGRRPNCGDPVNELVIHRDVAAAVRPWARTVPRNMKLFPFTRRQAERLFHTYAKRAGVAGFKIYALRHTVGVRLWRHTRDLRLIQAIMGHARLKATGVYVHVPQSDLLRAMEAASA